MTCTCQELTIYQNKVSEKVLLSINCFKAKCKNTLVIEDDLSAR